MRPAAGADREPVRAETVTHPVGINSHLSDQMDLGELAPRAGLGTARTKRSDVRRFPAGQSESHERRRTTGDWLLSLDSNQEPSG